MAIITLSHVVGVAQDILEVALGYQVVVDGLVVGQACGHEGILGVAQLDERGGTDLETLLHDVVGFLGHRHAGLVALDLLEALGDGIVLGSHLHVQATLQVLALPLHLIVSDLGLFLLVIALAALEDGEGERQADVRSAAPAQASEGAAVVHRVPHHAGATVQGGIPGHLLHVDSLLQVIGLQVKRLEACVVGKRGVGTQAVVQRAGIHLAAEIVQFLAGGNLGAHVHAHEHLELEHEGVDGVLGLENRGLEVGHETLPPIEDYVDGAVKILLKDKILAKDVPSSSDFNSYTEEGNYCFDATTASTLANCPVSTACNLRILNAGGGVVQILTTYSAEPLVYIRTNYGSAWNSWYKFQGTVVA